MNLAVALLRMAPNRFESNFKKIFYGIGAESQLRCLKALYFLLVKNAKIENMNAFIKDKNDKVVILPEKKKPQRRAESLKVKDSFTQNSEGIPFSKGSVRISRFFNNKKVNSNRVIAIENAENDLG